MATIQTIEPLQIFAGDTLAWQINLPDYPASAGYTLNYRLINASGKIDITGAANGDIHQISVTATTSATYAAGSYDWQSYVTDESGERFTIKQGDMVINPNWAAQTAGLDTRSNAKQILDALEAAWIVAATKRAFVMEYKIANRLMKFATRGEWIAELDYWKREVNREERAKKIAAGQPGGAKIYVRF